MKGVYARTNQVAEVIQNIKLSLAAWKVLFIIDGKTDLEKFEHVLGLNEDEIKSAINELKDLDLIQAVGEEAIAVEEGELIAQIEELESEEKITAEREQTMEEEAEELVEEVDQLAKDLEDFLDVEVDDEFVEESELSEEELEEQSELGDLMSQIQEESPQEESLEMSEDSTGEIEEINEDDLLADLEKDLQDFMLEDEKTEEEAVKEAMEEEIVQSADVSALDEILSDEITEEVEKEEEPEIKSEEPPVSEPSPAGGSKKIMVVDDSVVIRKMVEIALENEPIDVVSAPTGKDALSKLDEEDVNLVILDLMLPDLNGLDILKAIKAASANLPVIILTGKDSSKDLEMAKEYGADDFITKPFKDEDLLSKVKSLL